MIFSDKLSKLLEIGIAEDVFSSASCSLVGKDRIFIGYAGKIDKTNKVDENTLFDLASLTKPLITSTLIITAIGERKLTKKSILKSILPESIGTFWENTSIDELLQHISGLHDYRYLFLKYINKGGILLQSQQNKIKLLNDILRLSPVYSPGTKSLYSDFGFFILGIVLERLYNKPLNIIWEEKYKKYGFVFNPKEKKEFIPPTEIVLYRKEQLVKGEVHDEHAYLVGGVAGHAGAFASISVISKFVKDILYENVNGDFVDNYYGRLAHSDSVFADGWDKPAEKKSQAGNLIKTAIGHLGYTGTSLWVDFDREIGIILLTNRTFPSRFNRKIAQFRPNYYNKVIRLFDLDTI